MPKNSIYPSRLGSSRLKLASLIVLAVIGLGVGLFALDRADIIDLPLLSDPKSADDNDSGINYGPPTEAEQKEADSSKQDLEDQSTDSANSDEKKSVTPVITSWGQSLENSDAEVSGFVPEIVEDGGICTLKLEKGSQTVTESKSATADASSVSCGLITIARGRLSPGSWNATLSYSSSSAQGVSRSVTLEVD